MEEVICGYCPCKFLSLTIDNGTMTGRGYLWVLSLQIFVIDYGTMTGRDYLCNKFLLQQIFKIHVQRIGSHRKPGTVNWSPQKKLPLERVPPQRQRDIFKGVNVESQFESFGFFCMFEIQILFKSYPCCMCYLITVISILHAVSNLLLFTRSNNFWV